MGQATVLIVDDEAMIRVNLRALFEDLEYRVLEAADVRQGLEVFARERPEVVLTDMRMPEMDGLSFIQELRKLDADAPVIVVSGVAMARDAIEAVRRGAWDYVLKPIQDSADLEVTVRRALQHALLLAENRRYRDHLEDVVSQRTRQLQESEQQLRKVADALSAKTRAIREQAATLMAASRVKEDFLNKVTHELRTPLNAILGFSDGLLRHTGKHPLDDHQRDRIGRINSSGQHLLNLVTKMLDIDKIESGKLHAEAVAFEIRPLTDEIAAFAAPLLKEIPQVAFRIEVEKDTPPIVSDRNMMGEILKHLLSNAIRFTRQGTTTLRIRQCSQSLVVEVEDTGIGIPAEHLDRVFEKFYQAPGVIHHSLAGAGLGLAISKSYAAALGGSIAVRSVEGQGSVFTLTLPQEPQPENHGTDSSLPEPIEYAEPVELG